MAMCNIPSTNDDPSYRYKMPKLISKKEGRGNGSKTCIVNMPDVARALKRPPQYTTKWFGAELGAQSTYTDKEGEGIRAIVNGHHDTPIFQTMLDKFIDKFVLCENCHLPEIDMFVKKGNIVAKCKACGWAGDLDNNHKIATFIIKNPPDDQGGFSIVNLATEGGGGTKKGKDERRKERDEKRKTKGEDGDDAEEEEDEEAKEKRRAERRAKKESGEKKEKKSSSRKEKKEGEDGEEEDEEAKEKRRQERREKKASGEKKEKKERSGEKKEKKERSGEKKEKKESSSKKEEKPADSDADSDDKPDDEEVEYDGEIAKSVIGIMKELVEKTSGKVKPDDFFEELRMQQLAKLFDHKIRFYVALESLMPAGAMDGKAVTEHKPVLNKVLSAVKMPESDILWCFDAYLSQNEKSVKSFPMVLKLVYDEDWASEAAILKYYVEDEGEGAPGFQAAKTSAAPFLKWLQTAEESDDDESEEEESSDEDKK